MSKVIIKIKDNGFIKINGEVELVDQKGNIIETPEKYGLCRCGLSTNMPFCTGDHRRKFESVVSK